MGGPASAGLRFFRGGYCREGEASASWTFTTTSTSTGAAAASSRAISWVYVMSVSGAGLPEAGGGEQGEEDGEGGAEEEGIHGVAPFVGGCRTSLQ